MKSNFTLTLATLLLLMATGCSPRVYTTVFTKQPVSATADEVHVYQDIALIPSPAEALGEVSITNKGYSSGCSYKSVLYLAQKECVQLGGNGLYITEHRTPTLSRKCHELQATIIYTDPSVTTISPITASEFATRQWADEILDLDTLKIKASRKKTVAVKSQEGDRIPRYTFYGGVGYGFTTSAISFIRDISDTPINGVEYGVGYQHTPTSAFGYGVRYTGYSSSYQTSTVKSRFSIHYIALDLLSKFPLRKWGIFTGTIGIGYAWYDEHLDMSSELIEYVGIHAGVGIEYKIAKHIGLGTDIMYYLFENNKLGGFGRISLTGCIHFYLW